MGECRAAAGKEEKVGTHQSADGRNLVGAAAQVTWKAMRDDDGGAR